MVDGEFERLCVLYNIAALMSQIGSEANMQTDDGLKAAAKYFQVHESHPRKVKSCSAAKQRGFL